MGKQSRIYLLLKIASLFLTVIFIVGGCSSGPIQTPNRLTIGWLTCQDLSNEPPKITSFTGKVLGVFNVSEMDTPPVHTENVNGVILGDTMASGWMWEGNDYDKFNATFTRDMDEVGAIVCVNADYQVIEQCYFGPKDNPQFTQTRLSADTTITLIAWPSKEVIARAQKSADQPDNCYSSISSKSAKGLKGKDALIGHMDIMDWVLSYKANN